MNKPIYYLLEREGNEEWVQIKKEKMQRMGFFVVVIREGESSENTEVNRGIEVIIRNHCDEKNSGRGEEKQ